MKINNQKGFTLVELLMVIAIIGVLSSIVLSGLNQARSKARDARRKVELRQITTLLEMYYDTYGAYPRSNVSPCRPDNWCVDSLTQDGNNLASNWIPGLEQFGTLPHNPLPYGSWGWTYHYTSDGSSYFLMTYLENTNDRSACGGGAHYTTYWGTDACAAWGAGIIGFP